MRRRSAPSAEALVGRRLQALAMAAEAARSEAARRPKGHPLQPGEEVKEERLAASAASPLGGPG